MEESGFIVTCNECGSDDVSYDCDSNHFQKPVLEYYCEKCGTVFEVQNPFFKK